MSFFLGLSTYSSSITFMKIKTHESFKSNTRLLKMCAGSGIIKENFCHFFTFYRLQVLMN